MMNVLSGRNPPEKPVIIEFSTNTKLPLIADTGADVNAINKQTLISCFLR